MTIRKRYIAILLVLAIAVGAGGTYGGLKLYQTFQSTSNDGIVSSEEELLSQLENNQETLEENFGKMNKVVNAFSTIQENYVEDVGDQQLIEGAIEGMLQSLDDPYSTYMDAETMEKFNQQIESSFEGIGAEVSMKDGNVTIVAPIKDSPAEEAGLKPNDQILSVDGESLDGYSLQEAVNEIRGEKGSEVVLEVRRPGVEEVLEVDITRDSIPLETVYPRTEEVNGKLVGVIELTSFSETTAEDFKNALSDLEEQGIDGLVIDVRGNPGGVLTAVEEILKQFVPQDTPYLQIEYPNGKKQRQFSNLTDTKDYPIVTLINEGSASASEILAVSLKEAVGAEVVGTTSFGKGTVQQPLPLGEESTIKLTRFKWLSPEGNWIHEKGVQPTVKQKQPEYYYTNPVQIEDESLAFDQSDSKIANVQQMLAGLGYDPGRTDGYFSEQTRAAVEEFQTANDLEVTGAVDQATADSLQTRIMENIQSGEDDQQLERALQVISE
ncbi:carboxyl-terminal protease [Gracilibacillus halophilus YIM-C55.5]|uniref:C-terminal processing peptidase n=1 Tax=Gracilibacillus halophilus YIM-C55.5 TaxID=1308866 RepID=N4WQM5_9BACI|nr:S41 family peptidase [Gracilibacillus halophilus]ENH98427.1 carboxyl-terminal protease [Gracilibacillus halophilus YIM-C55.5]